MWWKLTKSLFIYCTKPKIPIVEETPWHKQCISNFRCSPVNDGSTNTLLSVKEKKHHDHTIMRGQRRSKTKRHVKNREQLETLEGQRQDDSAWNGGTRFMNHWVPDNQARKWETLLPNVSWATPTAGRKKEHFRLAMLP